MKREEIVNRQKEIVAEISALDLRNVTDKKIWKNFKSLCAENSNLQRELDKIDGKTYMSDKWITSYVGSSSDSLKAARLDLIEQIKNLPGVEVGTDKSGVVGVSVYTEYKVYHYMIHAHYRVEAIPESKRIRKNLIGHEYAEYDYRQVYEAYVETNGQHWEWRY